MENNLDIIIDSKLLRLELAEMRKNKNLTQAKVAERSGLSKSTISNTECGEEKGVTLASIMKYARANDVAVEMYQSNYEGDIVTKIQQAYKKKDGIVINAGAYTHTSIAILDALKAVGIPTAEVHISKLDEREDFRQVSYVGMYACHKEIGKGFKGYVDAINYLINNK